MTDTVYALIFYAAGGIVSARWFWVDLVEKPVRASDIVAALLIFLMWFPFLFMIAPVLNLVEWVKRRAA